MDKLGQLLFCALALTLPLFAASPIETDWGMDSSMICSGRLTLVSGTPIPTTNQTGKTRIYFTPHTGNKISLYDGSVWKLYTFSELSLDLGTLTNNTNYDVFAYSNGGTPALDSPVAWAGATTRTTEVVMQDGIYVKSGAPTRRYLGTFRTTSTTTTEDSTEKRFLWNYYHRVRRSLYKTNATDSWVYSTNSWRAANGESSYAVHVVAGLSESHMHLTYTQRFIVSATGGYNGICEDCANTGIIGPDGYYGYYYSGNTVVSSLEALTNRIVSLGYHYYTATELGLGVGAPVYRGADLGRLKGYIEN